MCRKSTELSFSRLAMSNRIIFQHIPKVAGTSLASLFVNQFDRNRSFICGSKDGVLRDFMSLEQRKRNLLDLLIGHVDYGIHHNFNGKSKYITFLRDPVERVLSHYYFIKSNKFHRYHKAEKNMDIDEFIICGLRPRMNNCMVRMISGENPGYNKCPDEMIDLALENLDRDYIFVGVVSHLSNSIAALIKIMGWKNVEVERKNVTKNKPDIQSMTEKTIDIIRTYNSLDMKFYDLIYNMFLASLSYDNYGGF